MNKTRNKHEHKYTMFVGSKKTGFDYPGAIQEIKKFMCECGKIRTVKI